MIAHPGLFRAVSANELVCRLPPLTRLVKITETYQGISRHAPTTAGYFDRIDSLYHPTHFFSVGNGREWRLVQAVSHMGAGSSGRCLGPSASKET